MLTAETVKKKAREWGATVCGIGRVYDEPDPRRDPRLILPHAKCIVGFGFLVPRALFDVMGRGAQYYTYTTLGVKYPDEELAEIFLLKMCGMIEDEGYDACPQKSVPNLRVKGDGTTNPEVVDTYELVHATAVAEGKPAPEVIIDFGKAAAACGIGERGMSGKILHPKYGPYMRYCFLITDAPLSCDEPISPVCDGCGECIRACPGHAISEEGLDTWQCAVYYKGAHHSNPFLTEKHLGDEPDREAILRGEVRFDAEGARRIMPKLHFLPNTQWGYAPCLCGRACDRACFAHLKSLEGGETK